VVVSFDSLDRGWLVKFIEHRIADRRVVRLIQKWLNAGVLEEGKQIRVEEGTPQGGSASPLLANIYLNNAMRADASNFSSGMYWRLVSKVRAPCSIAFSPSIPATVSSAATSSAERSPRRSTSLFGRGSVAQREQ